MSAERKCKRCKTRKPETAFRRNPKAPDGLETVCIACNADQVRLTLAEKRKPPLLKGWFDSFPFREDRLWDGPVGGKSRIVRCRGVAMAAIARTRATLDGIPQGAGA